MLSERNSAAASPNWRRGALLRIARLSVGVGAAFALSACEMRETSVEPRPSVLVVHSVLNKTAVNQVVLLERSLSGQTFVGTQPFNTLDPIVTGRGVAVSGATVQLLLPDGSTLLAREDAAVRPDGTGAGVYRASLAGSALIPGGTYELRVRTADGAELSATTTVPLAESVAALPIREFNRDGAPLTLSWAPVTDQARYAIQIASGNGAFSAWTDVSTAAISGSLRHTSVEGLPRVFTAGFDQAVTVLAVDANYYD